MPFESTFPIRFADCDEDLRLTPLAFFVFLQETAIAHSASVGLDGRELAQSGYAWMMNRMRFQVDRYPVFSDTLTIRTWPHAIGGLYAIREFAVTDGSGKTFGRATSRWLLIDVNKRKIIRIPDDFAGRYGDYNRRAIEDDFPRLIATATPVIDRRFHVRRSDLDPNRHANSAAYVDWALEATPPDVAGGMRPEEVELVYRREAKVGEEILVTGGAITGGEPGQPAFEHVVYLEGQPHELAICRSRWKSFEPPARAS